MGAILVGDLKELPNRPGIAVPHQFQKTVALQHCPVLFAAQYPPDVPRHLQVCRSLLHQLPGQGIEHPQPRKMAVLRDLNHLTREDDKKTFDELMQLVKDMDQEEQRYVREGFSSDEELSLYDMLFSENLSKQDIQKIKQVAVDLLQKVKVKIAELDHWTDKQETKATIDNLIRDTLWSELPECYDELSISGYRQRIYEYVYTRYKDVA